MVNVLLEVKTERIRQDSKWGVQDHPSVIPNLTNLQLSLEYGVISESAAKRYCDKAFDEGKPTWAHIAVEELAEVIEAKDENTRRTELIQLAAVCVAWVESIDRNTNKNDKHVVDT